MMRKYVKGSKGLVMAAMCLAMVISAGAVALPAAENIDPRYVAVTTFDVGLSISSSGRSACTGVVRVVLGHDADVTMELQQKDGNSWETIKDWSDSGRSVTLDHSWYVAPGHGYRVKLSAEVSDSSGKVVERPVAYSAVEGY